MGIVEQYLLQLKNEKRRWRRAAAILAVLSLLVATGVSWNLRMTGITIANSATCGQAEHRHTEECSMGKALVCEYEGETTGQPEGYQTLEAPLGHIHTDACYETTYRCGYEEHVHALSCYSDPTADMESAAIWEADLPKLTNDWVDDLVLIAQSQLGCAESEVNYITASDGETRNGITRYGQWYGNPYGDWSGMFIMFCLKYADIPQEEVPRSPGVYNMMRLAQDAQIFRQPDEKLGTIGNLLFLDTDANANADRIAVVCEDKDEEFTAIGGDWENTVAELTLSDSDPRILGYIDICQLQEEWRAQEAADSSGTTEPDAAEPTDEMPNQAAISLDVEFPEEGILRLVAQISNIEEDLYAWQWQFSEDGNEPWIDIDGATELICDLEDTEENYSRYYRLQGRKVPAMLKFMVRAAAAVGESPTTPEVDDTIISAPIAPFSIGKNNNVYTIDVYALPVDADGNRITDLPVIDLGDLKINSSTRTQVKNQFDGDLGIYQSAYFGSLTSVSVDNINTVWRQRTGTTRYLCYAQVGGRENTTWKKSSDSSISLYLRYVPYAVTFTSDGFTPLTEDVEHNGFPTLTEPATWMREGYTLLGWTVNGNEQQLYTFEEIIKLPVTGYVTYTAKWVRNITVSFDLGEHAAVLDTIEPRVIPAGGKISPLPIPIWKYNSVAMAFDGWYLNEEQSERVTADYEFYEDITLYAGWRPKDEGYYVYFMDFAREGKEPLVSVTYSVTEGQTVSSYIPENAPSGTEWDGKWYLEGSCINAYKFSTPVSDMKGYLTGAHGRDLYLYPGKVNVCRAIFVTYGTRVDPITVPVGGTVDLEQYRPERPGFTFAGWTLQDGTPVSGAQRLTETTTFVAKWNADYVRFEAILRIENANDTGMTQADILGTWYAKAGSQIRVKSTYSGKGNSRVGKHTVVCVLDGVEYPVYKNEALTQQATLSDVYTTYFIYNNTGTTWTDEVNWDDVYTGGEVPYSTRPVSSAGDTIINFDYMRVRNDIVFTIPNTSSGGYIDVYKLQQNGLITGSVIYDGTKPKETGQNVSAHGVSAENISWSYTAATKVATDQNNLYTLHNMKYGQRIYEVYPVGGSWLTTRNRVFHWYKTGTNELFSSRREDLSADFFTGSGRALTPTSLTAVFETQNKIALMYAIECLPGETADFTIDGVGYKVQTQLSEVVNHTGTFSQKELLGCVKEGSANYTDISTTNSKLGGTSVRTLFGTTYWNYYDIYGGVDSLGDIDRAYIFYYTRLHMNIQFNFGYDANGNGANETVTYNNIPFGLPITEYQFGAPDYVEHDLLNRPGYEFAGWLDANGFVLEAEDWGSLVATGDSENNTMIFIAKWEKISNNIVEYYEDRSSAKPFESHYFDDGELMQYPTMPVYPEGWVWQEYGEGKFQRFDWDVPMYGEYGVQEIREINGEEQTVNVLRIYGAWDESHTKVIYDPNAPQGGVPGTAPTDPNEYTIWQSEVPVASRGETANADPDMVFVGWQLDRNGLVYQPGDHVPVQWPRTMIFTAQWAKEEEVVFLRYDPNGGTPEELYPDEAGFPYRKNAAAAVWDNTGADGTAWFSRTGYVFAGWNTKPDGSGTACAPDSSVVLTEPVTTLYAQWKPTTYTLSVHKVDAERGYSLIGAEFGLYQQVDGVYCSVGSLTTDMDGCIVFPALEADTLYKLIEENPPNGYAVITKEIYFALRPNGGALTFRFCDAAGREISTPNGVSGEYFTGDQLLTVTVKNLRGYALPSTGGTGIFFHMLCGLILVSAPLVYGLSLRRKHERRSRE